MRILIAEDDATSRMLLKELLAPFGEVHVTENGNGALEAYRESRERGQAYELICLDIMMPDMDGQTLLREIRLIERGLHILPGRSTRIIMTTALGDPDNVVSAFREQCDAYLVKPIQKAKLLEHLKSFKLIE